MTLVFLLTIGLSMKLEVGKTYLNYYGAKVEIFEGPIKGECHWYKGNVNDGQSCWKLFPSYFHEDGHLAQFVDGNAGFNLIKESEKSG